MINFINKKFALLLLFLLIPFLTLGIGPAPVDFDEELSINNVIPFFENVVYWLVNLLVIAGAAGVVISGYMFLTSGGDSGKVASARQILIFSLLGVVVGISYNPIVIWARGGFQDQYFFRGDLANIVYWLATLLAVATSIGVVISGYMFLTSGGDSGKVASARNILIYSLVGFIIGINATFFVDWAEGGFVETIFEVALENIVVWLIALLIHAAIIGVVISGYMFLTSSGDSGKVASARQMLIYSLVGVLVGSLSWGIIEWAREGFVGGVGVTIGVFLLSISNWLFSILLIGAVIGVVISGYMFVTSSGDSGKVASARNVLIYSLVGALVGTISHLLVRMVYNFFN